MMITGTVSALLRDKNQVWSIAPDATVYEAIQLMGEKNVGALPVMENGALLGMISERDYTRKVALHGKSSRRTLVREITSMPVISATPQHSIEDCMHLMTEHRVRHLPIVQGEALVGIISIGDLVNSIISMQNATIHQMESYITGGYGG